MEASARRQLLVSKGWVQAVLLVVLYTAATDAAGRHEEPTRWVWQNRTEGPDA